MAWKVGDWVIHDLSIGQIKKLHDDGCPSFSDGTFETSGRNIADRFRPLTLRNKSIVETFDALYKRLNEIDGNAGFNFPDIFSYFAHMAREAIDGQDNKTMYDKAQEFVRDARDYKPTIQGVRLFRPQPRKAG